MPLTSADAVAWSALGQGGDAMSPAAAWTMGRDMVVIKIAWAMDDIWECSFFLASLCGVLFTDGRDDAFAPVMASISLGLMLVHFLPDHAFESNLLRKPSSQSRVLANRKF